MNPETHIPYQFIIVRSFAVYLVAFMLLHLIWLLTGVHQSYQNFLLTLNSTITVFIILNIFSYLICLLVKKVFANSSIYKVTLISCITNFFIVTGSIILISGYENVDRKIIIGLFYLVILELPRAGVVANLNERTTSQIQSFISTHYGKIILSVLIINIIFLLPEFPEIHLAYAIIITFNSILIVSVTWYFVRKIGSQASKKTFMKIIKIKSGILLILLSYSTSIYLIKYI